jgi:AraC-like DNA-binding protein
MVGSSDRPRRATRLGLGWAVHRGNIDDRDLHKHSALQISFSDADELFTDLGGATVWASTVLIRSGIRHSIRQESRSACSLFIDSDSQAAAGLVALCGQRGVIALSGPIERAARNFMRRMIEGWADGERAYENFSMLLGSPKTGRPMDPRISRALESLVESHRTRWPLRALAGEAGLSTSQFAARFKECTGLPVRTHVRWLRIHSAIRTLSIGADRTSAARAAGFASAVQFSNAFRHVFGLSPALFASSLTD